MDVAWLLAGAGVGFLFGCIFISIMMLALLAHTDRRYDRLIDYINQFLEKPEIGEKP